jgi:hypothetical protein
MLPCGKTECVFRAIDEMVRKMKGDIAEKQHIQYPEQIVVAGIYDLTASTLAEACRRSSKTEIGCCLEKDKRLDVKASIDTFILLRQLKDEDLVSAECEEMLFKSLLEMNPSLKEQVEKDRELGIL